MNIIPIVQITEICNIGCKYCLRPSFAKPPMSEEVLEEIIKKLLNHNKNQATFIWHGGEPLIAGINFFRRVLEFQQEYNRQDIRLSNIVQTNALLMNEEYAEFFQTNGFQVGTSIDGTKEIHDKYRQTFSGDGTYDRVIKKIEILKRNVGSNIVLTREVLGKEEEIYYSLKPHVKGLKISEYFPAAKLDGKEDQFMPTPEEYGNSMVRFYEIWKNDKDPIDVLPITSMIKSFLMGEATECQYSQKVCSSIIGIDPEGIVYTCLRGVGDDRSVLGDIRVDNLSDLELKILSPEVNPRIKALLEGDCGSCEFWNYCNGGCPQESLKMYGDTLHKTYYCEGRKILFSHILKDLTTNAA